MALPLNGTTTERHRHQMALLPNDTTTERHHHRTAPPPNCTNRKRHHHQTVLPQNGTTTERHHQRTALPSTGTIIERHHHQTAPSSNDTITEGFSSRPCHRKFLNSTLILLQMSDWLICTQMALLNSSNSCFLLTFYTNSTPQLDITYNSSLSKCML